MATDIVHDSRFPDNPNSDDLRKLDRQIAERLGWRVEQWVFTPDLRHWKPSLGNYKKPADSTVFYRLVRPTGDVAYPYGKSADDPFNGALPHYTRDANAFFKLIGDMYIDSGRQAIGDHLYWATVSEHRYRAYGTTRLVAGCLAWLKWFDDNHGFTGTEYLPIAYTYPAEPGGRFPTLYVNADGWEVYLEETHSKPYTVSTPSGDPLTGHATLDEAKRQADYYAEEARQRENGGAE